MDKNTGRAREALARDAMLLSLRLAAESAHRFCDRSTITTYPYVNISTPRSPLGDVWILLRVHLGQHQVRERLVSELRCQRLLR